MDEELDLCTTKQLIDALGRRFKHVLVATSGACDDSPTKHGQQVHWRGGPMAALGLAEYARDRIVTPDTGEEYGDGE